MEHVLALIPDISLETANKFYTFGWVASLTGAAITFAGVIFLMWGTRVRDIDFEHGMTLLNSEAATARERAGRFEEQAAVLEKETASAKLETERLKEKVSWRNISPGAAGVLIKELSGVRGSVAIGYIQNDPEALMFAIQIGKIFERLNEASPTSWSVLRDPRTYTDRVVFGLFIPGPETETVKRLRMAFSEAQISFSTDDVPDPGIGFGRAGAGISFGTPSSLQGRALILVGSKTPTF